VAHSHSPAFFAFCPTQQRRLPLYALQPDKQGQKEANLTADCGAMLLLRPRRFLTLLSLFVKMNAQLTNKAVSLFSSPSQDTAFFAPLKVDSRKGKSLQ
jgi:hypothetical protein